MDVRQRRPLAKGSEGTTAEHISVCHAPQKLVSQVRNVLRLGSCCKQRERVAACFCDQRALRPLLPHLDAKRDWGHARDYVEMMWMCLQQDTPDDFVAATGEAHSVREFCQAAFTAVGIEIKVRRLRLGPYFYRGQPLASAR